MKEEIRKIYIKNKIEFDELDLEISEEILKHVFAKRFLEIAKKKLKENNASN
ncbi:hypothetical protein LZX80_004525 [Vibrio parahaemolyticus]|nr:hypothetical protein [Vibrio parahaemolyticus]HCM2158472.1 hypothetical protein [Vibrio parahaemolyticus]